ncbi:MAG: glycosyltransferase, partial [Candidatus Omnitrophica bacterium]|nr:glycosyltransferase [Candidatus Omnitrophota bacterium]
MLLSNLVSAVIVSCNKKDLLSELLLSLKRQSYKQVEKIVVLNNFPKEEVEDLRQGFPDAIFIPNKENLFYCKAQNQGIRVAKGEFILCLNDDLIVEVDFIEEMVRAAKKDERIGMVSGCIMRQNKETVDTAGLFLARSRKPLERGYGQKREGRYKVAEYIFGAGGVAPLYRRRMLEEIKMGSEYFDEDYDIFYEDLDIAWRARNCNWKGYYTPQALAYHIRGATVKRLELKFPFLRNYSFVYLPRELKLRLLKNRYMTIIKNDNLRSF